jgi:hypothetical protein
MLGKGILHILISGRYHTDINSSARVMGIMWQDFKMSNSFGLREILALRSAGTRRKKWDDHR